MVRGKRKQEPDYTRRGVFADRSLGIVRAVSATGKQVGIRLASDEDMELAINELQWLLDEKDPIPHGVSLPLPDAIPGLRLIR